MVIMTEAAINAGIWALTILDGFGPEEINDNLLADYRETVECLLAAACPHLAEVTTHDDPTVRKGQS